MMQLKVATEYRGYVSYICNYNLTIRTLICINLNDPTLGMGLDVIGDIYSCALTQIG